MRDNEPPWVGIGRSAVAYFGPLFLRGRSLMTGLAALLGGLAIHWQWPDLADWQVVAIVGIGALTVAQFLAFHEVRRERDDASRAVWLERQAERIKQLLAEPVESDEEYVDWEDRAGDLDGEAESYVKEKFPRRRADKILDLRFVTVDPSPPFHNWTHKGWKKKMARLESQLRETVVRLIDR